MRNLLFMATFVLLLVGLSAGTALAAYSDSVLADNPVAYWQMSETDIISPIANSGTAGSTLDGVANELVNMNTNGPAYDGFASGNSAAYFTRRIDESVPDAIDVNDPGTGSVLDFGAGDAMTLELWFKSDTTETITAYLLGKGRLDTTNTDQNYSLRLTPFTNKLSMLFRTADDSGWGKWESSAILVQDDKWHHFVFAHTWGNGTVGSGSTGVYYDGVDITASGAWDSFGSLSTEDYAPVQSNSALRLGSSQGISGAAFTGGIDEVAIYRSKLNQSQVLSHYAASGKNDGGYEFPEIPAPARGLYNGNFEVDVPGFPSYGWNEIIGGRPPEGHTGLSATGLAEGTQAVIMQLQSSMGQEVVSSAGWELDFLMASLQPTDRSLNLLIHHGDVSSPNPMNPPNTSLNIRVNGNGDLQAYNDPDLGGGGWTTISGCEGVIDFSIDADEDGMLESAEDTLNVQSLKIVGFYDSTPSYDIYLSAANSETLTLLAEDVSYFQGALPEAGTGPVSISFLATASDAAYIIDQVYYSSPELQKLPGDANLDGTVDASDAAKLADNWLSSDNVGWGDGDFNDDGVVDDKDATLLATNWGKSTTPSAAVPEPSVLVLILAALSLLAMRKRIV